MKAIKIIVMVLTVCVTYQFAEAQGNCPGNKIQMAIGSKGCGCSCTKKCVDPADTASYRAAGWYFGACIKFCCFADGFRSIDEQDFPVETSLTEIYPNPASGIVTIAFTLAEPGDVSIEVYDLTGRYVTSILHDVFDKDGNEVSWDASEVNQGIYFLRMIAGNYNAVKRISVIE